MKAKVFARNGRLLTGVKDFKTFRKEKREVKIFGIQSAGKVSIFL